MSQRKTSLVDGTCTARFSRPVDHLGQDEHGTWLGARRRHPGPTGRHGPQEHDDVRLVTDGA